ncbi:MAG: carbohydrate ABC transporter permease [Clostridiales bacterium]|jgi:multiple sugar transport system permease protein|nr:carbohydrate ABC transporter permease [Clostridiales bacterium]
MANKYRRRLARIVLGVFGTLFCTALAFPFYWQFVTALRNPQDLFKMPPELFPSRLSLTYLRLVFAEHNFGAYLLNSVIVSSISMLLSLIAGMPAAYAISRVHFKGRSFWSKFILSANMFPIIAVATPLFITFRSLGLINTYAGLVIPSMVLTLPVTIWTLRAFLIKLPIELEHAALVDGCNRFSAFVRIILPLIAPGVFATAIIAFIGAWNELMFSLIFITKKALRTVPMAIAMMPGEYSLPWGEISAASIVSTLPVIIVVLICQKQIIAGLTAGAVKG